LLKVERTGEIPTNDSSNPVKSAQPVCGRARNPVAFNTPLRPPDLFELHQCKYYFTNFTAFTGSPLRSPTLTLLRRQVCLFYRFCAVPLIHISLSCSISDLPGSGLLDPLPSCTRNPFFKPTAVPNNFEFGQPIFLDQTQKNQTAYIASPKIAICIPELFSLHQNVLE
jgi:hypothetical protein